MITGVFGVLLGEAVLLGSTCLFYWFLAFVTVNLLHIPLLEEPGSERRFGAALTRPTGSTGGTCHGGFPASDLGCPRPTHLPIITFRSQQGISASRAKRIM